MDEQEYWDRLEYRVCRELARLDACRARGLWCDGFLPDVWALDAKPTGVRGRVWMGAGPRRQEEWTFSLVLGEGVRSRDGVPWSRLLPPDELTRWLHVDLDAKHLELDPAAAVPAPAE